MQVTSSWLTDLAIKGMFSFYIIGHWSWIADSAVQMKNKRRYKLAKYCLRNDKSVASKSLFTLRKPDSPLNLNVEQGFHKVNRPWCLLLV